MGGTYPSDDILNQLTHISDQTYVGESTAGPHAGSGLKVRWDIDMKRGARYGNLLGIYSGGIVGQPVGDYVMTMWPGGPMVAGATDTSVGENWLETHVRSHTAFACARGLRAEMRFVVRAHSRPQIPESARAFASANF